MGKGVVSAKRRASARKHAKRAWTCVCGKVCRGNGGISGHRSACDAFNRPIRMTSPIEGYW